MHVIMGSCAAPPAAAVAPLPAAAPAAPEVTAPAPAALPAAAVIVGAPPVGTAVAGARLPPEPALAVVVVPLPAAAALAPDEPVLDGDAVVSVPAGVTFVAVPELEQPPKKHAPAMTIDPSARSAAGLTLVRLFMVYLATSHAFMSAVNNGAASGRLASRPRLVHGKGVCASHLSRQ